MAVVESAIEEADNAMEEYATKLQLNSAGSGWIWYASRQVASPAKEVLPCFAEFIGRKFSVFRTHPVQSASLGKRFRLTA